MGGEGLKEGVKKIGYQVVSEKGKWVSKRFLLREWLLSGWCMTYLVWEKDRIHWTTFLIGLCTTEHLE